jgi:hypothetical protein
VLITCSEFFLKKKQREQGTKEVEGTEEGEMIGRWEKEGRMEESRGELSSEGHKDSTPIGKY